MTDRESEQWARERRSQGRHLLARGCLIKRFARDKHLGVELATRDALRPNDILCVLTSRIAVCHTGFTPYTLPSPSLASTFSPLPSPLCPQDRKTYAMLEKAIRLPPINPGKPRETLKQEGLTCVLRGITQNSN